VALAIARIEQQQLAVLAAINRTTTATTDISDTIISDVPVTPMIVTKEMSSKQIIDTMLTSESKVVATTIHDSHFVKNSDNNITSDSGSMLTDTGTSYDDSNTSTSIEDNAGIGPILDMTSYNRFKTALARLQLHASVIS
jgi:replicative DNA helicase